MKAALDALRALDAERVDGSIKGMPPRHAGLPLSEIGRQGWNLLHEDLAFPVACLKESALRGNRRWMQAFLAQAQVRLAPHAKTTLSPQLFCQQMDDGAWALTAATANQVAVLRRFGVPRILIANQVVGRENIALLFDELAREDGAELLALVDSPASLQLLLDAARGRPLKRPLGLLVEVGAAGGRTGMRSPEAALALARAVAAAGSGVALRGIEAYESVFPALDDGQKLQRVEAMLAAVLQLASQCRDEQLFAPGEVVLSAGGSEYFDIVARRLRDWRAPQGQVALIRSGCYLAHDHLAYARGFTRLLAREPALAAIEPGLEGALEVWGVVQSRPEPGLAFATVGKRDISFDFELPSLRLHHRPGQPGGPAPLSAAHKVLRLNDQHAAIECPDDSSLAVGDLLAFGISHPCTTFDKWPLIFVVDDDYRVISAIRTLF